MSTKDIFKIEKNHIFDANTGNGYEVVRDKNGTVVEFRYVFSIHETDTDNIFETISDKSIPIGVLRKSAEIIRLKRNNRLVVGDASAKLSNSKFKI